MRRSLLSSLAVAAFAATASLASAQSSASGSVNVTGTVLGPIAITGVSPLAFGSIGQGVNKTIAPDGATSGRFLVQGQGAADVGITLTLPATLTSGANTMIITNFTGTNGQGADAPGGTAFTPTSGVQFQLTEPGTGAQSNQTVFVRLGAQVQPTVAQAPGAYTGSIAVSVVYLGT